MQNNREVYRPPQPLERRFPIPMPDCAYSQNLADRSNFLLHFAFIVELRENRSCPARGELYLSAAEVSSQRAALRSCNSHGMRNQSDFARYTPVPGVDKRSRSARHACISDCGGASFPDTCTSPPQMAELKSRIDRRDGCETSKKSSGVAVVRLVRMPAAGRVLRLRS